jgi:hypothetical protein
MFKIQQAQRKVEYENDLSRQDKQFKMQSEAAELGNRLTNLKIKSEENSLSERALQLQDMDLLADIVPDMMKDPFAPLPEGKDFQTAIGKQTYLTKQQNLVNQNIEMAMKEDDSKFMASLSTTAIPVYKSLVDQMRQDAMIGKPIDWRPMMQFKRDVSLNPEMQNPYYGSPFTRTYMTGQEIAAREEMAQQLEDEGNIEEATRIRSQLQAGANPSKFVYPTPTVVGRAQMSSELKSIDDRFDFKKRYLESVMARPDDPRFIAAEKERDEAKAKVFERYKSDKSKYFMPGSSAADRYDMEKLFPGLQEKLKDLQNYR